MSTNLEIESKALITKKGYDQLCNEFSNLTKYTQINYYILPKNICKIDKKYGLRIREKSHQFELTLKEDNGSSKIEINQKISKKSYVFFKYFDHFPQGEVKDYLVQNKICDPSFLRIIGKMKTSRIDINFESSLISIDKSKYNHKVDYEVECEDSSINLAEEKLSRFLSKRKITYEKSKQSKLARFLNTK